MAACRPAIARKGDRQINDVCSSTSFGPDRTGDFFTLEQVMFDPGKHAAPVTAIECFVDDPSGFNVNAMPFYDFVINPTKQLQDEALISHIRI